jgi:hypothetical protein
MRRKCRLIDFVDAGIRSNVGQRLKADLALPEQLEHFCTHGKLRRTKDT